MSISSYAIPKKAVVGLRNVPRDIFDSLENAAPAVGAVVRINLDTTYNGVGLDLDISNAVGVAGAALITIDKTKQITLAAGQRFTLENVLFMLIEIRRAGAGAILVNSYFAGVTKEALAFARP